MSTMVLNGSQPSINPLPTLHTLLLIDDDPQLTDVIRLYLERKHYRVVTAKDGEEGIAHFRTFNPDLVILDVMMPKLNGFEVCRRLREMSATPIIMLSARGQDTDRVQGLRLGADDYICKPFSLRELEARVETVMRRIQPAPAQTGLLYRDPYLVVDAWGWKVTAEGQVVDLTAVERHLLVYLVMARGATLPVEQLLATVWADNPDRQIEYVKLYIRRLRQKIEPDPENPRYVLTQRGRGYRFAGYEKLTAHA